MATIEEICKKQGVWAYGEERSGAGRASEASQTMLQSEQVAQFPYAAYPAKSGQINTADFAKLVKADDELGHKVVDEIFKASMRGFQREGMSNPAKGEFKESNAGIIAALESMPNAGKATKSDSNADAPDVLTRLTRLEAQMRNPVSEATSGQTSKDRASKASLAALFNHPAVKGIYLAGGACGQ